MAVSEISISSHMPHNASHTPQRPHNASHTLQRLHTPIQHAQNLANIDDVDILQHDSANIDDDQVEDAISSMDDSANIDDEDAIEHPREERERDAAETMANMNPERKARRKQRKRGTAPATDILATDAVPSIPPMEGHVDSEGPYQHSTGASARVSNANANANARAEAQPASSIAINTERASARARANSMGSHEPIDVDTGTIFVRGQMVKRLNKPAAEFMFGKEAQAWTAEFGTMGIPITYQEVCNCNGGPLDAAQICMLLHTLFNFNDTKRYNKCCDVCGVTFRNKLSHMWHVQMTTNNRDCVSMPPLDERHPTSIPHSFVLSDRTICMLADSVKDFSCRLDVVDPWKISYAQTNAKGGKHYDQHFKLEIQQEIRDPKPGEVVNLISTLAIKTSTGMHKTKTVPLPMTSRRVTPQPIDSEIGILITIGFFGDQTLWSEELKTLVSNWAAKKKTRKRDALEVGNSAVEAFCPPKLQVPWDRKEWDNIEKHGHLYQVRCAETDNEKISQNNRYHVWYNETWAPEDDSDESADDEDSGGDEDDGGNGV